MRLKAIKIGGCTAPNNVFLAPLAGYTNCVFRHMCSSLGAGLTFTEMVSAKGLCYDSRNTRELLALYPGDDGIKAVQIFGGEPEYMRRAAQSAELAPFDIIDINMGCPVPKIFKNGEGSALMADIPRAQAIVRAVAASGKPVTVKFRTGLDGKHLITRDFALAMQDAGAALVTIHGRTRDKIYSGAVAFDEIAAAKSALSIPVIANGGVFSLGEAEELMDRTGADGIAVARAAMYDPFIFCALTGRPVPDKKSVIAEQIAKTFELFDERFAVVYMRKMLAFYTKGVPGAAEMRRSLFTCADRRDIEQALNRIPI